MKNKKYFAVIGGIGLTILTIFLVAADHVDAPDIAGTTTDIADFYAFEGDNPDNTVFVVTVQGPLVPGHVTDNAQFDEDVLIEFNIDNTGDLIEDLVIQAIKRGDSMYFFGPVAPSTTGLTSEVETSVAWNGVQISTSEDVYINNTDGMSFFAGPRRDDFYFDFNRYNLVISGDVAPAGFLPPEDASDLFADLNVLAIVVEVPNSKLGSAPPHLAANAGISGLPPSYNVWVSAKRKQ